VPSSCFFSYELVLVELIKLFLKFLHKYKNAHFWHIYKHNQVICFAHILQKKLNFLNIFLTISDNISMNTGFIHIYCDFNTLKADLSVPAAYVFHSAQTPFRLISLIRRYGVKVTLRHRSSRLQAFLLRYYYICVQFAITGWKPVIHHHHENIRAVLIPIDEPILTPLISSRHNLSNHTYYIWYQLIKFI
jgi:hypothetical protein